ncbi:MAG: magnesium and cobalt transport protein CorA, partial [Proteobacteria bacterium]|nr:magnesium and cobalt transport protein CorA [candidate division Zixibacteria bacterium]NIQ37604.1 magnesium and cobalt transport protein CorA [Pseudomonadota bacterium]
MKVLTIIATIFIPLTFIAGIYGMNFKFMPELEWRLGYPIALAIMLLIVGSMLFYFRRKKWL